MTQTTDRIADEFAKFMTDAAGFAQGMKREADTFVKTQAERLLRDMDLPTREEFEAVRDMAVKAREGERGAEGAHRGAGSAAFRRLIVAAGAAAGFQPGTGDALETRKSRTPARGRPTSAPQDRRTRRRAPAFPRRRGSGRGPSRPDEIVRQHGDADAVLDRGHQPGDVVDRHGEGARRHAVAAAVDSQVTFCM